MSQPISSEMYEQLLGALIALHDTFQSMTDGETVDLYFPDDEVDVLLSLWAQNPIACIDLLCAAMNLILGSRTLSEVEYLTWHESLIQKVSSTQLKQLQALFKSKHH